MKHIRLREIVAMSDDVETVTTPHGPPLYGHTSEQKVVLRVYLASGHTLVLDNREAYTKLLRNLQIYYAPTLETVRSAAELAETE